VPSKKAACPAFIAASGVATRGGANTFSISLPHPAKHSVCYHKNMKTPQNKHIVIFSHGFEVRRDDRGLFPDIIAGLSDATPIMFDYGTFDPAANTLAIPALNQQAAKLKEVIAEAKRAHPGATIDLICHSQGCVVAALCKPSGIRKIIFTAPPAKLNVRDMTSIFAGRAGSHIDFRGDSRLSRADFSTTIVPKEYWASIEQLHPIALYNELAKATELTIINASQDEVIGKGNFSGLAPNITVTSLHTGHNFTGSARQELTRLTAERLAA
jgi:hypothetical protein